MKTICLFFLIVISNFVLAQDKPFRIGNDLSDSIDRLTYAIDNSIVDSVKSNHITIDSIDVNYKKHFTKIETVNILKKSSSKLLIDYYFDDTSLVKVSIKEISPFFNDLFKASVFYYQNGTKVYSNYFRAVRICMAQPWDAKKSLGENLEAEEKLYGYNPCLTVDFLEKYSTILLQKLKRPFITLKGEIK